MRIVQFTTDNRNQLGDYTQSRPYFGTAPTGLLEGFAALNEVEVHVVSCASVRMETPEQLAPNIYFHQPLVSKWDWGRSLFLGCVSATRKLLRDIQPDIVHGQGTERDCAMEAVFSGYPNVLTIHGNMRVHATRADNGNPLYYRMAASLERLCLKRTDGVVAISRYTQSLVSGLAKRNWLVPNAVDGRFFHIQREEPLIPKILFVGMLNERKNPLALLRVCRGLLERGLCTVAFAGDGNPSSPYFQEFNKEAQALPGVELLGFLGREELASHFRKSSFLVLPTFEDNCPMVVLEAMASGLPVAASRVGGIPDLIEDGKDGLLFEPGDIEDLARCIERLIHNPEVRSGLANAARETAYKRFHSEIIAREHVRIYKELLSTKR